MPFLIKRFGGRTVYNRMSVFSGLLSVRPDPGRVTTTQNK